MLDSSIEYKLAIRENTKTSLVATVYFADNTTLSLTGNDFIMSTASFDDSSSNSSELEIGSAITNTFSVTLNNFNGKFDSYDFTGAILKPTITKELSASTELIPRTFYIVDQPDTISSTITLKCNDNMSKTAKKYSNVTTSYPCTVLTIMNDICNYCGIVLDTQTFNGYNTVINARPSDSSMSCTDMISYVAQITCNYARIGINGHLNLKWYDVSSLYKNNIDGGNFTPYTEDTVIDGGDFTTYQTTNIIDGGNFTDAQPYHAYAINSFKVSTDDVVITGIRVTTFDNKLVKLQGSEGYVLEISGNPLVTSDNYLNIAQLVGNRTIGYKFRPFSISTMSDPTVEAGDPIVISKNGNDYDSFITRANYKFGNYETLENTAKSPQSNSSVSYSASTKTYQKSADDTDGKLTAYDVQMQSLSQLAANAFGTFKTEVKQADNSVIYYYHNKPTLAQSNIVWKITGSTFTVSTDGGVTWNAGIDANGNAVVNVLSVIGLNATWITVGDLTVGGTSNNKDGSIVVKDSVGTEIGRWNKNGISISKGSLNINNKFIVDTSGNMTAVNGTFSGTISSSTISSNTITGNTISGNTITGGSININNRCIIDSSGNLTATNVNLSGTINASSGSFSGSITSASITSSSITGNSISGGTINGTTITGGSLNINNRCSIDSSGNLTATNVNLSGVINATSGNFSGSITSSSISGGTISGAVISGTTINGGNLHIEDVSNPDDQTRVYIKSTNYGTYLSPGGCRSEGPTYYGYVASTEMGVRSKDDTYHTYFNTTGMVTSGSILAGGNLQVYGTKNRVVKTKDYGELLHYAYETSSPYFGDIGEGITDELGICVVDIDDMFTQTIDTDLKYQVFLQKYGEGELYVSERNSNHFIVKGSSNLSFGWEIKAIQNGYDTIRLEQCENDSDAVVDESIDSYIDELLSEYTEDKDE